MLIFLFLVAHAELTITVPPVHLQETTNTNTQNQTISGPNGSQTIDSNGNAQTLTTPFGQTTDSNSHTQVNGPNNTGIEIGQKVYYKGMPTPVAPSGSTITNSTGPGSIDSSSHSTTTKTPNIGVLVH